MKADIFSLQSVGSGPGLGVRGKTIYGVKVIELGPVNDERPFLVDMDTLRQVESMGNRPNRGIKSRFTHPTEDALGTHLGRLKNFRIDGDCVRADLEIAESSHVSPKGDMGGYVLALAIEDPESLGASLAIVKDVELMQESGHGGLYPLRIAELYSVDIVGDPAATRGGLFSMENDKMTDDAKVEEKEEDEFAYLSDDSISPEDKIRKLAESLGIEVDVPEPVKEEQLEDKEASDSDKVDAADKSDEEAKKEELSIGNPERYLETFGDRGARWYIEKRPFADCVLQAWKSEKKLVVELKKTIEVLSQKVKAADVLKGEADPLSASVGKRIGLKDEDELLSEKRSKRFEELKSNGVSECTAKWAAAFSVTK